MSKDNIENVMIVYVFTKPTKTVGMNCYALQRQTVRASSLVNVVNW